MNIITQMRNITPSRVFAPGDKRPEDFTYVVFVSRAGKDLEHSIIPLVQKLILKSVVSVIYFSKTMMAFHSFALVAHCH